MLEETLIRALAQANNDAGCGSPPRVCGPAWTDRPSGSLDAAFAQHALLRTMRAMTTWFYDAYASWQKGGVENANGRL
jgi:hypothetical protein